MTEQNPHEVYGKLKEGVHVAGYTFERALTSLDWILKEDRWKKVGAFADVNKFLDSIRLDEFAQVAERRKSIAKRIKELQPKASNRQIAKTLGTSHQSVGRAVGPSGPPRAKRTNATKGGKAAGGPSGPFSGAAAARAVGRAESREARQEEKKDKRAERESALAGKIKALPAEKFGVLIADPQWGRTVFSEETGMDRHAANHYPVAHGDETTQDDAIKALDVGSIAAADSVLGLWCTEPWRGEAVARAWGFEPVAYFVWVKDVIVCEPSDNGMLRSGQSLEVVGAAGLGFWNRDRAEIMLICTRGNPICPAPGTQGERVWFARRGEHAATREDFHSDKPECSLEWFERHWPNTPKIELHRRGAARPGWVAWRNEVTEAAE
jgi:N6-adenosine-specific RNA methylase IME4